MQKTMNKRKRWIRWLRIAGVLLILAFFLPRIGRAYWLWYQERLHVRQLQSELAALQSQNRVMQGEVEKLSTPGGMERKAREQGWVRPGEEPVIIPQAKEEGR
jgi:cell division protein FtsB